jgi:CDP-glucose 4,6-dehydratase
MGQPSPSFWHHRRVFVTGCTGFLGAWVVRELLARGANVIGLVRDRARPSDLFDGGLVQRVTTVRGRVEDRWRVESAMRLYDVQTVIHLAAPPDQTQPLAARWLRTVLAASARSVPSAEVVVPVPAGDGTGRVEVARRFARQAGYPVGLAELPRLFGGGDRTWSRLVPWTARAVLCCRPVEPLRDEERAEPHLYARDAARACLWLAEALAGDPEAWAGRAVPFTPTATGAELFDVLTAPYLPSRLEAERPGGRDRRVPLAPDHAGRWQPTVPLLDAVAETVAWYRRYFLAPEAVGPTPTARTRSAA